MSLASNTNMTSTDRKVWLAWYDKQRKETEEQLNQLWNSKKCTITKDEKKTLDLNDYRDHKQTHETIEGNLMRVKKNLKTLRRQNEMFEQQLQTYCKQLYWTMSWDSTNSDKPWTNNDTVSLPQSSAPYTPARAA